jgi:hypothetical protein
MLPLLGIYFLGIALCVLAGVVVRGLLYPSGRWFGFETVPLGFCTVIALLYPLGAGLPSTQAAPIALGLLLAGGAIAALRLARLTGKPVTRSLGGALRPHRSEGMVVGCGAIGGLVLLIPTLSQGFPTTITTDNYDGWAYATLVDWLKDHPFPRDVANLGVDQPLTLVPSTTIERSFAFGFEHFAALLAALTGRDGFEVVNAAAAVSLCAAVGGWAVLAAQLRSRLQPLEVGLIALTATTPLLALPFANNFTTQFVSICLWPFAVGAFLRFARGQTWQRLLIAAIAAAGVIGVYPAMVPWLVLPFLVIAVLGSREPERAFLSGLLRGLERRSRFLRAALIVVVLVLAVAVIAPIQVMRVIPNLQTVDATPVGGIYSEFFSGFDYASLFFGASNATTLFERENLGWSVTIAVIVIMAIYLLAFVPHRGSGKRSMLVVLLAVTVVATTATAAVRYRLFDEQPYQIYKALILGGGILAGLAVVALTVSRARSLALPLVGIACVAAVWIFVSSQTLRASADSSLGFRAADVEMGRALQTLPAGSTVLAEGAAPDDSQFRMMAAYFDGHAEKVRTVGLGNTSSFLTVGGLPAWRPAEPWTHVLSVRRQPLLTNRIPVWHNGTYSIDAAPPLDVTLYGRGWYPPEYNDNKIYAWMWSGAELVLANRTTASRRVRLSFLAGSYATPRTLRVSVGNQTLRRHVDGDATTPVSLSIPLPAMSTRPVHIDARPGALAAPRPDRRSLMLRIEQVRVTGFEDAPGRARRSGDHSARAGRGVPSSAS